MWNIIVPESLREDPWQLALQANALYECPKDPSGKRLGPLVPYAGKDPATGKNLVGDVYFNFAMVEEQPLVVAHYAQLLREKIGQVQRLRKVTTIVGIPEGGRTLGQRLAESIQCRFVYPLKVPKPKAEGAIKDEYDLVFKRLELSHTDLVLVCDDVHNNFQNTDTALTAIARTGARVIGLCSALNRSPHVDNEYIPQEGALVSIPLPVVSVIRRAIPEYKQSDPEVADDIARGNIEPKVKDNWAKMKEIMRTQAQPA